MASRGEISTRSGRTISADVVADGGVVLARATARVVSPTRQVRPSASIAVTVAENRLVVPRKVATYDVAGWE